jgi:hypothetical protein
MRRKIFKATCLIGALLSSEVLAANNNVINPEIANISYWYGDEDIRAVLQSRLGASAYIAPAAHNDSELIDEIAANAVVEAGKGKPVLIPVNLNNSHWVALAIRKNNDGNLIVFFNDSLGGGIGGAFSESSKYLSAIKAIAPNAQIIDLMVHQQNDGSSCGAFTAENLIAIANLDMSSLTAEAARAVLSKINDARAIRLLQLGNDSPLYQKLVAIEEVASSVVVSDNIEALTSLTLNNISNLESVISDRLGSLYLADNVSGFSSGDSSSSQYGIWFRGNIGTNNFKFSRNLSDLAKIKTSSRGGAIGIDTKLDEETTIGIAASYDLSTSKTVASNINQVNNPGGSNGVSGNSFTGNTSSIIGSLYGSFVFNEALVFSGNASIGKVLNKTSYRNILNNNVNGKVTGKASGNLMAAGLRADYYMPILSFTLVPNLGVSYDQLKISKIKQSNFSVSKTNIRKISVSPGISVIRPFEVGSVRIVPELTVSGSFSHIKSGKISIKNDSDLVLTSRKLNLAKSSFDLGGSLTLAGEMLEVTIGYNRVVQKNNLGNNGYVKLRVNL